ASGASPACHRGPSRSARGVASCRASRSGEWSDRQQSVDELPVANPLAAARQWELEPEALATLLLFAKHRERGARFVEVGALSGRHGAPPLVERIVAEHQAAIRRGLALLGRRMRVTGAFASVRR